MMKKYDKSALIDISQVFEMDADCQNVFWNNASSRVVSGKFSQFVISEIH